MDTLRRFMMIPSVKRIQAMSVITWLDGLTPLHLNSSCSSVEEISLSDCNIDVKPREVENIIRASKRLTSFWFQASRGERLDQRAIFMFLLETLQHVHCTSLQTLAILDFRGPCRHLYLHLEGASFGRFENLTKLAILWQFLVGYHASKELEQLFSSDSDAGMALKREVETHLTQALPRSLQLLDLLYCEEFVFSCCFDKVLGRRVEMQLDLKRIRLFDVEEDAYTKAKDTMRTARKVGIHVLLWGRNNS